MQAHSLRPSLIIINYLYANPVAHRPHQWIKVPTSHHDHHVYQYTCLCAHSLLHIYGARVLHSLIYMCIYNVHCQCRHRTWVLAGSRGNRSALPCRVVPHGAVRVCDLGTVRRGATRCSAVRWRAARVNLAIDVFAKEVFDLVGLELFLCWVRNNNGISTIITPMLS